MAVIEPGTARAPQEEMKPLRRKYDCYDFEVKSKHNWYITSQDEVIVGNWIEVVDQFVAPVQIGGLRKAHIQISIRNLLT